ncbi:putative Sin3 binding protein-domain-containing protein [Massariosphaeria phaeospora]|uniref:Putative Sin3 binding protein-domain-containing protein n=1 Tax=Massariosphaeria phaeospora TaxID=100035 RepID=A0A7C8IBG9_9PLEO|nr:putative Sin3 binding protein-domain-containing protein [Massariosphaeria phaeospora]
MSVSNLAVAFATRSASSNIPIARDGSRAVAPGQPGLLPTPPNSISPTLAAHKHRPHLPVSGNVHPSPQVDMDIDLEDAIEHAAVQDQPAAVLSKEALAGLEATRQITAVMLAKHHLPGIILGHGAMPIREMMAHLTQSVPGFSGLPPSKARRLIVAALEHRAGGGPDGEVKFEKVGWGRWSVAGQSQHGQGLPIGTHGASRSGPTPPASADGTSGPNIHKSMRNMRADYSGSWGAVSPDSSRDEDMADRMSLDGSESESDASDMDLENDLDDDTDLEDWSAIGPEALRQRSCGTRPVYRDYNYLSRTSGVRFRSASAQSASLSRAGRATPALNTSFHPASRGNTGTIQHAYSGVLGTGNQDAEREAIEALIAMGSM